MLLQKPDLTKAQSPQQRERCKRFAAGAADAIGAADLCLFSVLPYQERERQAASWYDACALAMLRGNYALLDEWIREQARMAAAENFNLEDLLQLLRICRRSAIKLDGWDEDALSEVDAAINDGLRAIRANVSWNISGDLNYLTEGEAKPLLQPERNETEPITQVEVREAPIASVEVREGERRESDRNRLALPVRVHCATQRSPIDEITRTENVSVTGLYFKTQENYRLDSRLQVTFPYWTAPGSINREYSARVSRLDRLPDGFWGVAVEFLENLRNRNA